MLKNHLLILNQIEIMKKKNIIFLSLLAMLTVIGTAILIKQYYHYSVSNFTSHDGQSHAYHLRPGCTTDSVLELILEDYEMTSKWTWNTQCQWKGFHQTLPGYYRFPAQLSNREMIRRLQFGEQTPLKLSFTQTIRTREQLAAFMGKKLLLDSAEVKRRLDDKDFMLRYGLTPETAVCMFIPNTYEVYWTMTPDQLFDRMYKEYKRFWTEERLMKAKKLGLKPTEVATIASIIASETNKSSEFPIIASIYINRLRKGMALQACPTVIFAVGDFSLRRVLKKHLEIDSPYNTYKYRGLPPGPIRLTRPDLLDAVLNAPRTDYLYMCANPDFSGTHVFSSSYAKHSAVAREYQRELNRRKL